MAKYNREFLVPYLRDVCALHLAEQKLQNHITKLEKSISDLEKGTPIYRPKAPVQEPPFSFGRVISLITGGLLAIVTIGLISSFGIDFAVLLIGALSFLFIFCPIQLIKEGKQEYETKRRKYVREIEANQRIETENKKNREKIPTLQAQVNHGTQELQKTRTVRQKVYGTNVIPGQYRDIYAAVYLYDYFSNSREDDLSMALNTFVLEQIKSKLDIIIANQSEMILNQTIMLANQQNSIELQSQHAAQMRALAQSIAASAEEQSAYLSMIESNTATTAYFATADFIRRI